MPNRTDARNVAPRQGALPFWSYLAAVTAARCNADMRAFYQRRIADGTRAKVAIIAVARKLAVLANTLIHEDRFWQPHAPK